MIYFIILIYPFLNILISYLSQGKNMNTFSSIYCLVIIVGVIRFKSKISRRLMYILLVIISLVILDFSREQEFISIILYILTICMFNIYSQNSFDIKSFSEYINRYYIICFIIQILFLLILWRDFTVNGLYMGWGTIVLKGPYLFPHTLAYLLFLLLFLDIFLFLSKKGWISILGLLMGIIMFSLVILTAVRTTLLGVFILFLFCIWISIKLKKYKAIFIFSFIIFCSISLMIDYGLFEALIDKSILAMDSNNITNGRDLIIKASLMSLDNDNILWNLLFGVGFRDLIINNQYLLGEPIHAHNDFIDIFVSYGIVSLFIYCMSFYNFAKKKFVLISLTIGILAYSNGLYWYIDAIPMIIFSRLLFEYNYY